MASLEKCTILYKYICINICAMLCAVYCYGLKYHFQGRSCMSAKTDLRTHWKHKGVIFQPSLAKAGLFPKKWVNTKFVDTLTPSITRSSAILTTYDNVFLSSTWRVENMMLCFPKQIQRHNGTRWEFANTWLLPLINGLFSQIIILFFRIFPITAIYFCMKPIQCN